MANVAKLGRSEEELEAHPSLMALPPEGAAYERIREVLRTSGPSIVFQPIVDLKEGTPAGFESLARFAGDPPRPPNIWFDEARSVGLHAELELAAIVNALAILETFPKGKYLSVNVSPDIACSDELASVIARFPTERIVLEITERAAVDDYEALQRAVGRLRDRGVRFAIDDIGAGFANMSHVLQLRPEILKLDRGFTTGIESDHEKRALVSSMVQFANNVGSTIVAEGIETVEEAEALATTGIVWGQGYYFARPAPPSERLWQLSPQPISIVSDQQAVVAGAPDVTANRRRRRRVLLAAATFVVFLGAITLAGDKIEKEPAVSLSQPTTESESPLDESPAQALEAGSNTHSIQDTGSSVHVTRKNGTITSIPTTSPPAIDDSPGTSSGNTPTSAESSTLGDLRLDPEVIGGTTAKGTITLTSQAPPRGITLSLLSSNPAVASVPSTLTVPAGSSTASFDIAAALVWETTKVTISAVHDAVRKAETLTVFPATRLIDPLP